MDVSSLAETLLTAIDSYRGVVDVFLIVLATATIAFVVGVVLRRLMTQAERTNNRYDDALIDSARRPAALLVWVTGLALAAQRAFDDPLVIGYVETAREVGVVIVVALFASSFSRHVEARVVADAANADSEARIDETTVTAIGKIVRLSIAITAGLTILQSMGISISGVLAFGGIGGIAVGFAARDLLANFFGALMIFLDRPFSKGDWIRSPDRNIEGTVEDIGWRLTRIRTFDQRPLYVPNSVFTSLTVENPSRMFNRRIYETFGVRYADVDVVKDIVDEVREYLSHHDAIDTDRTLMVHLNAFGESSLDFFVYTFTRTTNWVEFHGIKEEILLHIADVIRSHGAAVAFPTRTLDLPEPQAEHLGNAAVHSQSGAGRAGEGRT